MKLLGYLEKPQQAVNQLFAMGHFHLALYMQQNLNMKNNNYEELT